jgi:ferredoxin
MRVAVDRGRCQDHGQCAIAAPEVFRIDDGGQLVYVSSPDEAHREAVEDAADVCPLQAITVED